MAAPASTISNLSWAMKRWYAGEKPMNLATRRRAFFSMVKKVGDFYGDGDYRYTIKHGNAAGVSTNFSDAQTATTYSRGVQMAMPRKAKYGAITLSGEFLLATKKDKGAFLKGLEDETDSIVDEVGHRIAIDLYGSGTGSIGRRSGALSGNIVTLTNADDAKNFTPGLLVVAGPNDSSSGLRSGSTTVASVNEAGGTVTLTDQSQISGFLASDYLFVKGDPSATMTGLAGHIPLTAPSPSESFYGTDRTVNMNRLAGWRVNDSSLTIEETILTMGALVAKAGGRFTHGFIHPEKFADLCKQAGSRVMRDSGGEATLGFESVKVATGAGVGNLFPDPECPSNRVYMLELETWELNYLGSAFPHIVDDDGNMSIRQTDQDGIEVRVRAFGNLRCKAPGKNAVGAI